MTQLPQRPNFNAGQDATTGDAETVARPNLPTARPTIPTARPTAPVEPLRAPAPIKPGSQARKIPFGKEREELHRFKDGFTFDDLLEIDYDKRFKPLEGAVVEAKGWLQKLLQDRNEEGLIAEARRERGEKYDNMREVLAGHLLSYFSTENVVKPQDVNTVITLVMNEIIGLGPIEPLWVKQGINDIMVNGPYRTVIQYEGKNIKVPGIKFRDKDHLLEVAQQILLPIEKTVDQVNPLVDGRLSDGSRVNITHPYVGPDGPFITIRRFPEKPFTIRELLARDSINEEMAIELGNYIAAGFSMVVVGGTGAGKTSFLNALSGAIPYDERIITIEDSLELQLHPEADRIALEAKTSNQKDGTGAVPIRSLVKNTLRMAPKRIIVGEVRDFAVYDMLQAMSTGHEGSMTTVHANDARGAITRLVSLMNEGGGMELARALSIIAGAVDLLVVIARFPEDGSRRVVAIEEVPSLITLSESGDAELKVRPLWRFRQDGYEPDDRGRRRITGHYEKVNDLSDEIREIKRLEYRDRMSLEEILKNSDIDEVEPIDFSRENEEPVDPEAAE